MQGGDGDLYHSITFGKLTYSDGVSSIKGKNTWDDWHLIPSSRPLVNPPPPNLNIVNIPGTNEVINLTNVLTGNMTYSWRSGSWSFIAENGFKAWHNLYTEIMKYLHGKSYRCILEDDQDHYYDGYFTVSGWNSGPNYSTITIDYKLYPFKFSLQSAQEPWKWDPFNFETGIIRSVGTWDTSTGTYGSKIVVPPGIDSTSIRVYPGDDSTYLTIYASSFDLSMTYRNRTYSLDFGEKDYTDINLRTTGSSQYTTVYFSNSGSSDAFIVFNYRVGEL